MQWAGLPFQMFFLSSASEWNESSGNPSMKGVKSKQRYSTNEGFVDEVRDSTVVKKYNL